MTKLDQLYAEKGKKFDEICALLARELGYGEFARINPEGRKYVEEHAEQQVSDWEETTEFRLRPDIRPSLAAPPSLESSTSTSAKGSSTNRTSRLVFGPIRKETPDAGRLLFRSCGLKDRKRGAGLGRRPLLVSRSRAQPRLAENIFAALIIRSA